MSHDLLQQDLKYARNSCTLPSHGWGAKSCSSAVLTPRGLVVYWVKCLVGNAAPAHVNPVRNAFRHHGTTDGCFPCRLPRLRPAGGGHRDHRAHTNSQERQPQQQSWQGPFPSCAASGIHRSVVGSKVRGTVALWHCGPVALWQCRPFAPLLLRALIALIALALAHWQ